MGRGQSAGARQAEIILALQGGRVLSAVTGRWALHRAAHRLSEETVERQADGRAVAALLRRRVVARRQDSYRYALVRQRALPLGGAR